jgi:hypothetical protein
MAKHTTHRRRSHSRKQKGRGYSFGGSILGDDSGANAGNPLWAKNMGSDCGIEGRGGNNTLAGGARKTRHRRYRGYKKRRSRKQLQGGNLALQQPRGGYTFNGSGVAGTSDPIAQPAYATYA